MQTEILNECEEMMVEKINAAPSTKRRWTAAEELYLTRNYLARDLSWISKKLNRTEESLRRKAERMDICIYGREEISAKTLAACFNSDIRVIKRWKEKFNMPCKTVRRGQAVFFLIDVDKFWIWANKNKQHINWSKYELMSLPPEPDWVKKEKNTYDKVKGRTPISETDISMIHSLVRRGFTYKEIGKKIGRTETSVKHIMSKRSRKEMEKAVKNKE